MLARFCQGGPASFACVSDGQRRVATAWKRSRRRPRAHHRPGNVLDLSVLMAIVPTSPGENATRSRRTVGRPGSARYTSGDNSIDVMGFDGVVGECHDCKVNPSRFKSTWVHELQRDVAPHGMTIGLVTAASSRDWAAQRIQAGGVTVVPATTIVTAQDFHPLVPLQDPRAA